MRIPRGRPAGQSDPERGPLVDFDLSAIVPPPSSFTVETERRPLLYLPDGRALVRRPVGFRTDEC